MTRTSALPPASRTAPSSAAQPATPTPTATAPVAEPTVGWHASNRGAAMPATVEGHSTLTSPTLASLFVSRGLTPTINLDLLKTDAALVATAEPPHADPRGAMLANSFFS